MRYGRVVTSMPGKTAPAVPRRHCWEGLLPEDDGGAADGAHKAVPLVGPIVLLAVDLYVCVFPAGPAEGGPAASRDGRSCGRYATLAVAPIQHLIDLARHNGIQVIYTTSTRRSTFPGAAAGATRRLRAGIAASDYEIHPSFEPAAGELVLEKARASAFFGTPLVSLLAGAGVRTVVVCGETTSGCVRATAVDAFSYGFNVLVVEDCVFDRNPVSHKVNLYDVHHKYAEVVFLDELERRMMGSASAGGGGRGPVRPAGTMGSEDHRSREASSASP